MDAPDFEDRYSTSRRITELAWQRETLLEILIRIFCDKLPKRSAAACPVDELSEEIALNRIMKAAVAHLSRRSRKAANLQRLRDWPSSMQISRRHQRSMTARTGRTQGCTRPARQTVTAPLQRGSHLHKTFSASGKGHFSLFVPKERFLAGVRDGPASADVPIDQHHRVLTTSAGRANERPEGPVRRRSIAALR